MARAKLKVTETIRKEEPKVVGHPVYMPSPDMGDLKPPKKGETGCKCDHKGETHYGGERGHCNHPGCLCLEFGS